MTMSSRLHSPPAQAAARENAAATQFVDRTSAPRVRQLEGIVEGPGCHAIIETVFADLINGPLAHMPSGRFGANSAWILCAAISHNLLRAAGVLAGDSNAVARGATLRRRIVNLPARPARPQRRSVLHLPSHWPWASAWKTLWRNTIGTAPA
jgi:hypothetical protein